MPDNPVTAVSDDTVATDPKDVTVAREHEVKITEEAKSSWLQKNVAPILAIISVSATLILFYFLVFTKLDPSVEKIVLYILGVLSTILSQVYSYYFGSSAGSKAKQEQLFKKWNGS